MSTQSERDAAVARCLPFLEQVFAERTLLGLGPLQLSSGDAPELTKDPSAVITLSFDGALCCYTLDSPLPPTTPWWWRDSRYQQPLDALEVREIRAIEAILRRQLARP